MSVHEFRLKKDSTLESWDKFVRQSPKGRQLRARKEVTVKDGRRKQEIVLFHQTGKEGLLEKMQNWWFAKEQRALAQAYVSSISMLRSDPSEADECFKNIHEKGLVEVHAGAVQWIQVEPKQHDAITKYAATVIKPRLGAILCSVSRMDDGEVLQALRGLPLLLQDIPTRLQAPLLMQSIRKYMRELSFPESLRLYTDFIERAGAASLREALVNDLQKRPSSAFGSPLSQLDILRTAVIKGFESSVSITSEELKAWPDADLIRHMKALRSGNLIKLASAFEQEIATRFAKQRRQFFSLELLRYKLPQELREYQARVVEFGLSDKVLKGHQLPTLEQVDAELMLRAEELYAIRWKLLASTLAARPDIGWIAAAIENFREHTDPICKDHGLHEVFAVYARKNGNKVIQPGATMRCFHRSMIAQQSSQTVEAIRKLLHSHAKQIKQGGKQFKSLKAMLELLPPEREKPIATPTSSVTGRQVLRVGRDIDSLRMDGKPISAAQSRNTPASTQIPGRQRAVRKR